MVVATVNGNCPPLTAEEIRIDVIFCGRWRDDLNVGVDGRGKPAPALGDVERIAESRPVESVLVHPVTPISEEVCVVDVVRSGGAVRGSDFSQPVEHHVESTLITPHGLVIIFNLLFKTCNRRTINQSIIFYLST